MKELKGKVAVITGAASGIGRALAKRCVREGMKVVLSDIEEESLAQAGQELHAGDGTLLAVRTDVSKESDIEALAQKAVSTFGRVHLLINNAGVGIEGTVWESTVADWEWVMGVNLWSLIYSVRTFVPIMLQQDTECHILNTASIGGLISGPGKGVYMVTKHGVVSLSETLCCDLAERGAKIKVSVLCPGSVNTRIIESARNRPSELWNEPVNVELTRPETIREVEAGLSPERVAEIAFQGIVNDRFYILTHPDLNPLIRQRMESILQNGNPVDH
jgi:NAD(P)-dependent dehydrogenase (short-subunit alcohol dehydrogenase family)